MSTPETTERIEKLAAHLRKLDDLGLGKFRLRTFDGRGFAIECDGAVVKRGSYAEIAEHCGFTA